MITLIDKRSGLIWCQRGADEVAWNGFNYISLETDGGEFKTLEDFDAFWKEYYELMGIYFGS